jgi:hypothetical protein
MRLMYNSPFYQSRYMSESNSFGKYPFPGPSFFLARKKSLHSYDPYDIHQHHSISGVGGFGWSLVFRYSHWA